MEITFFVAEFVNKLLAINGDAPEESADVEVPTLSPITPAVTRAVAFTPTATNVRSDPDVF